MTVTEKRRAKLKEDQKRGLDELSKWRHQAAVLGKISETVADALEAVLENTDKEAAIISFKIKDNVRAYIPNGNGYREHVIKAGRYHLLTGNELGKYSRGNNNQNALAIFYMLDKDMTLRPYTFPTRPDTPLTIDEFICWQTCEELLTKGETELYEELKTYTAEQFNQALEDIAADLNISAANKKLSFSTGKEKDFTALIEPNSVITNRLFNLEFNDLREAIEPTNTAIVQVGKRGNRLTSVKTTISYAVDELDRQLWFLDNADRRVVAGGITYQQLGYKAVSLEQFIREVVAPGKHIKPDTMARYKEQLEGQLLKLRLTSFKTSYNKAIAKKKAKHSQNTAYAAELAGIVQEDEEPEDELPTGPTWYKDGKKVQLTDWEGVLLPNELVTLADEHGKSKTYIRFLNSSLPALFLQDQQLGHILTTPQQQRIQAAQYTRTDANNALEDYLKRHIDRLANSKTTANNPKLAYDTIFKACDINTSNSDGTPNRQLAARARKRVNHVLDNMVKAGALVSWSTYGQGRKIQGVTLKVAQKEPVKKKRAHKKK